MQPLLPFDASPQLRTDNLVFIRHPRARRYVIRVSLDGRIRVTIPRWGSRREASAFAAQEEKWIHKQLARAEAERAALADRPAVQDASDSRARALRELPARVRELAAVHGLVVTRISVRDQKSRWGSCSRTGRISLNWRLVEMPPWVRDYVIIHELMHLKRMDHSPKFWRLVAAACPDYKEARRYLRLSPRV